MSLTCPKCQGAMRSYERNGVTIDQCIECRGVFLDSGELQHLIDAENRWHGDGAAAPRQAAPQQHAHPGAGTPAAGSAGGLGAVVGEVLRQAGQSRSGHSSGSYGNQYGGHYGDQYGKKRKKSFLDELFG